ncbi:MAG: SIR2 family protein [Candidatus Helarchaeota archaeon]
MSVVIPDDLIKAKRGRLMLVMVGAGVSAAIGLPTWIGLLKKMDQKISEKYNIEPLDVDKEIQDRNPWEVASKIYGKSKKFEEIIDVLREILEVKIQNKEKLPKRLQSLAELRDEMRGAMTTNFDNLLEATFDVKREEVIYRSNPKLKDKIQEATWFLFKMHGDWIHPEDLILTGEQYRTLKSDQDYLEIIKWIIANFVVLFVGYSLSDEYLVNLISDVSREYLGQNWAYAVLPRSVLDRNPEKLRRLRSSGIRIISFDDSKGFSALDSFLNILSAETGVPDPVTDFVGRENLIEKLIKLLDEEETVQYKNAIILTGKGGIGKTELARAFANRILTDEIMGQKFKNPVQVDLIGTQGTEKMLNIIRRDLGLSINASEEQIIKEVINQRAFIILDNIEDPLTKGTLKNINNFINFVNLLSETGKKGAFILGTCRPHPKISKLEFKKLEIQEFTLEEALELFFLVSNLDQDDLEIKRKAEEVIQKVGLYPLTVRMVAMYCKTKEILFQYLEKYENIKIEGTLIGTVEGILRTFTLAMNALNEEAKYATAIISVFPSGAPPKLILPILGKNWARPIFEALRYGLIFNYAGRYRMLEPIRQAMNITAKIRYPNLKDKQEDAILIATKYYADELLFYQQERNKGKKYGDNAWNLYDESSNLIKIFEWTAETMNSRLPEMLKHSYEFTSWAGPIMDKRPWIDKARKIIERDHKTGTITTIQKADLIYNLAKIMVRLGDPESSKKSQKYLIDVEKLLQPLVEENPDDLNILKLFAYDKSLLYGIFGWLGKNADQIVDGYEDALSIVRKIVKLENTPENLMMLSLFLNNIGVFYNIIGGPENLRKGVEALKESYQIRQDLANIRQDIEWYLARSEYNLAFTMDQYGDPKDKDYVEDLFNESIKRYKNLLEEMPGAILPLCQVYIYSSQMYLRFNTPKGYDMSKSRLKEAIKIYRKWAEGNPGSYVELAWALRWFGTFYRLKACSIENNKSKIEYLQQALNQFDEVIIIYQRNGVHGPSQSIELAFTKAEKAIALNEMGKYNEALTLLYEIKPIFENDAKKRECGKLHLGIIHYQIADILNKLTKKNINKIIKHYQTSYNLYREQANSYPGAVPGFLDIASDYYSFLLANNKTESAKEIYENFKKLGGTSNHIKNPAYMTFKGFSHKQ